MKTNGRSLAIALVFAVVLVGGLVFFKDVRSGPGGSPQASWRARTPAAPSGHRLRLACNKLPNSVLKLVRRS